MASILDQLTTERKRQSLLPMLSLLRKRVELDYDAVKAVDFKKGHVADGIDRYLEVQDGEVQIYLQSYYIHPHNRDYNTVNSHRGPVPEESIDAVYAQVRRALVEQLETEEKVELRREKDLKNLRLLIKQYGIPDDMEK